MKALLIANGNIKDYNLLSDIIKKVDFVLCVDGGVDHILRTKFQPDMVFGDLDSISKKGFNFIKEKKIPIKKYPSKKDSTDTQLAADYLAKHQYKEVILMGVTGSRQDHTLANMLLLDYLLEKDITGKIIDENNTIYLVDTYLKLKKLEGYYISLIPLESKGIKVTLKGFSYNLKDKLISFGSTLGLSNEIIRDYGEIKIHHGKALVFQSKD